MIEELLDKVQTKKYKIGIVGLGYVGLPLMWTFFNEGMPTIGFDIDENKVNNLNEGVPYIKHLGKDMMEKLSKSTICESTTDFSRLPEADAILMCVPTPLDHHREPDMSYVVETTKTVGRYLRKGQLVILESTTYPLTTEELITPLLEELSGLKSGEDFYVAYSPEREDPGNPDFNTAKIPKVVGGDGGEALKLALALYDTAIVKTVPVQNTKTAEAVKLTENIFRSVNIALVNELKVVYHSMGIDVHEVLEAAATKPFGFMKFTPGPGLGGHCIPIDPFYLTWKAREYEQHTRFIELAGEINTNMPAYVIDQTMKALNKHRKSINGSKILIIGLAYKPNVDDMRESPTFKLFDILNDLGADISFYDSYVPVITPTREHADWTGLNSIEWKEEIISSYDAVIISTNHSDVDYHKLGDWSNCIIDTRNAMKDYKSNKENHIFKA
ncbi:MAG TPA: nucleotide sugar dehydrogenase [Balneola sp.]|jgi:UDP-N-acetyl-D-glucosamine dehydrogenase|nr:UDP-N-acetyl-D-glucosamine dehydrogenase [Balneola sp.]MAO77126.1 UDP-N-acetyl-D-glucosamine dehydrogenase [Balneola sp.]MBF63425.1 UDP-N-acetyl-D-glucosamine dehydrogenase [Balneola sp.]HAH52741.1 nucleotide sugar dehydrogenase [Balneola sp.]HAW80159.1 nucleotide sugar dehydrogenase [Balneola sp.]|tara:strand:- start:24213 stop:25541 length:1329 start_codon:yes stop_codon:yes gene_type:complete